MKCRKQNTRRSDPSPKQRCKYTASHYRVVGPSNSCELITETDFS